MQRRFDLRPRARAGFDQVEMHQVKQALQRDVVCLPGRGMEPIRKRHEAGKR